MDRSELERLLAVARGDEPADLLIEGCRIVDLLGGRIVEQPLAVVGERIAGWGPRDAATTMDLGGRFVAPGWIDAHVHVESALVTPHQFAHAVVPHGVTTVVTDPHEIANVCGLEGIGFMLDDASTVPLELFVNAPSCVPATSLATAGARLEAADLATLLADPRVLGLAEVMNYPGVVAGDPDLLDKLEVFAGRPLDGHGPGLEGRSLDAYAASGISSDHECTTAEEALEKLSRGLLVLVREATNAHNLEALLPLVGRMTQDRICFCTDDRTPADLLDEGSVDAMVRRAIAAGVEPLVALRLASWNAARHYGLDDRGALTPGRRADLVVFSDLERPEAEEVWIAGRRVAARGRERFVAAGFPDQGAAVPAGLRDTVKLGPLGSLGPDALRVRAGAGPARVIGLVPDQLQTRSLRAVPPIRDGWAQADPARDLLALAVVERHGRDGGVGRGFVQGFGLRRGAIAGSVAHDHHNVIAVAADETSLARAVRAVAETEGGLVVVDGERIVERLPLPVGGLMSDRPVEEVRATLDCLRTAARELGSPLHDPFMALSFLGLEVIPSLKLTDRGLVDVDRFAAVPLYPADD